MINAVGLASAATHQLIDFLWGAVDAPKVALMGKGITSMVMSLL